MSDGVFGVTSAGFVTKRQTDIISDLNDGFLGAFGNDLNVDPTESVAGQEIGVLSKPISMMWDVMADSFAAQTLQGAEGNLLDDRGLYRGQFRRQATHSTSRVSLICGANSLVSGKFLVSSGHKIRKVDGDQDVFVLTDDVEIKTSDATFLSFAPVAGTPSAGQTYSIDLSDIDDGNTFSVVYTAISGDTLESVAGYLVAKINTDPRFTAYIPGGSGYFFCVSTADDQYSFKLSNQVNIALQEVGSRGDYRAENLGTITGAPNSLSVIVTPVSGLSRVFNIEDIIPGRPVETDNEFRLRIAGSVTSSASGTIDAVRNMVSNVKGVSFSNVKENRKGVTVGDLPPNSIAVTIDGEEGIDNAIAAAIWASKPGGIQTVGSISVTLDDRQGNPQEVRFTRPTRTPGYLRIVASQNPDVPRPGDWKAKIAAACVEIGSRYAIGVDIPAAAFFAAVYSVPGIGAATVQISKNGTTFTDGLLTVNTFERITFDESRIAIS